MRNTQHQIKRLELELQTCVQRLMLSDELRFANIDTSVILQDFCLMFEARIVARMAGQKVQRYKHPKTWLDAFKLRWYPKFLLKRYPVEYVVLETWQCYPEYPIPREQFGQPIQYFVLQNESYDKITEDDYTKR